MKVKFKPVVTFNWDETSLIVEALQCLAQKLESDAGNGPMSTPEEKKFSDAKKLSASIARGFIDVGEGLATEGRRMCGSSPVAKFSPTYGRPQ